MRFALPAVCLLLAAATFSALAAGELRGMLEDGRRVLLMPDGKWRFDTTAGSSTSASPSADQSPYQPTVKKFSVAFDRRISRASARSVR